MSKTTTAPKSNKTNKTTAAKPEAAKTPAKEAPARDPLGCRLGSQAATINAALTKKPKTVEDIAKATDLAQGRIRSHLKFLVTKKHVVESDAGFALK